jgi:hypothetical protein
MTETTRKRLEDLEGKVGIGDDSGMLDAKVQHFDISPDGDLVRLDDLSGPRDDRPAKRDIHVIFVDAENGRPGPCYLAWLRRRKAAGEQLNAEDLLALNNAASARENSTGSL